MPGFTYSSAASAAFRLSSSAAAMSRSPPELLDEPDEFVDHEVVELLAERLRRLRRVPRHPGPVLPRILHDGVRGDVVLPGRALALHQIGAGRQDPRRLSGAGLAISLRQDSVGSVDDVVVGEDCGRGRRSLTLCT